MDSSALVAVLLGEVDAAELLRVMASATTSFVSAVSFQETSMVIASRSPSATPWVRLDALIGRTGMSIVPHDEALAILAREAFLRFGKGRHRAALNLGDCASYALAKQRGLPLLFKGDDFTRTDLTSAL